MTGPQEEYINDQSVPSVAENAVPAEDAEAPDSQVETDLEETRSARVPSRISVAGEGTGELDAAAIERRARELAVIDGRREPEEADFARAEQDLLHPGVPPAPEEGEEPVKLWSENMGGQAHQGETFAIDDEENAAAELVEEGLQEADHNQRSAAGEATLPSDEEDEL